MLRRYNTNRLRRMFADQFEPDGKGFLYRKFMKSASIQVSAAERDRYVAEFDRFLKYQYWGLVGSTVVLVIGAVAYATATGVDLPVVTLYVGLGVIPVASMAVYYWAWHSPARELRDRGTVGEARSREEMRRLFLARLTYGRLIIAAGIAAVLLLVAYARGNMFSGWTLLLTGYAVVVLIAVAVQASRKWRFKATTIAGRCRR